MAILIAALLTISIGASTTLLSGVNAHTPGISWPTLAFCNASPNPCGVGQTLTIGFWLQQPPNTADGPYGDRWQGMTIKVTKPDATTETLGPFKSDDTGGTYTTYTPSVLGNYSFQMFFPGQNLTNSNPRTPGAVPPGAPFVGDYFQPSQSNVATVTVQQNPVPFLSNAPLPTSYWTRPINAMNYNWFAISGNWLGGPNGLYRVDSMYNPYTTGPESAHILWSTPEAFGGTVGGDFGNDLTGNYYTNRQYEKPFMPIIINGVLYYTQYPSSTANPVAWIARNLRTGQEIWRDDANNMGGGSPAQSALTTNGQVTSLLMGQVLNYISPNQFGGHAYLWSTGTPTGINATGTTFNMFDALTGMYIFSIVNGTGMSITRDASNNLIGYYVNSSTANAYKSPTLNMWNSTQCVIVGTNGLAAWQWRPTENAKLDFRNGIMWSQPIPTNISGNTFPSTLSVWNVVSNTVLLTSSAPAAGSFQGGFVVEAGFDSANGNQLWIVNRTYTPNTRLSSGTSYSMTFGDGVYVQYDFNTFTAFGYDIRTGAQIWSTLLPNPNVYDMDIGCGGVANGVLYLLGLGGDIYALNVHTGAILWQQTTAAIQGSAGSNTPYGVWPVWTRECSFTIADGKLYFGEGHEYSPPLFRGAREVCLNATTGQPIWNVLMTAIQSAAPISDGILTTINGYDNQIYAIGVGPSQTTVNAPNPVTTVGSPIVIRGTVTDISAGTKQDTVAANFPNGLPCVSDASQTQFMEAVYEQQPMPSNITGVPVTISVVDPNGNYRQIGSATSDSLGTFSLTWTADIAGDYKVIANFAGTQSYYGSSADSTFHVSNAAPTASPQAVAEQPPTTMYILGAAVAIIIAIAIVGIVMVTMLRKRP